MKSQRGVTLISLTIYIIVMTIVIGIVSLISTYFYENTHSVLNDIEPITEYTRFSSIFTEEVNHNNIKILAWDNHYVVFSNGVQYTYIPENKGYHPRAETFKPFITRVYTGIYRHDSENNGRCS